MSDKKKDKKFDNTLINAEKKFDKLAKEAMKIKVCDDDFEFLPYTEEELEEIKQANKIVDRIELIHLRVDRTPQNSNLAQ
ncbi:MAG: hypothetical protein EHM79_00580 [Geobacter sp.]|nr:MAG: hypothetical protein EHM79_00580 [Geobacter sp.]